MMATEEQPQAGHESQEISQDIDWKDYRDHLATADKEGRRKWVYAKKPGGKWHRRRTWVSIILITIMFAGPWVRITGNPLLMINIVERRFSILGQIFWPQDAVIFAVAMLIFITGIIIFTTAFGRLWCGWTCPQTVMMEMVFRKLEYLLEGDAHEQRVLNASPWTAGKVLRKGLKHACFLGISFIIGNTLLAYIIGSDQLLAIQFDDPKNHITGLTFMMLFTLVFYAIFARFREQACTFICPYGRLQSAMLDENSMVVSYDRKRGETRAPLHRGQSHEQRRAAGAGDCISCHQCVAVCPTGIDIRNGLQMECVNCTACIDACDAIMDKIKRPRGLIRFASHDNIEKGERQRFTPRMIAYSVVLTALVSLFLVLVYTRSDVETAFLRAPGTLYQQAADGRISNLYTLKIVNKTLKDIPIELRLMNSRASLKVMGFGDLVVPAAKVAQTSVLIEIERDSLNGLGTKLQVGLYHKTTGRLLERMNTVFAGPRW